MNEAYSYTAALIQVLLCYCNHGITLVSVPISVVLTYDVLVIFPITVVTGNASLSSLVYFYGITVHFHLRKFFLFWLSVMCES